MVERLNEIIELSLDLEPSEELGLAIRELMEEVVRLRKTPTSGGGTTPHQVC
jgi:hypothetical protein